ncbi:3-phosphoshikimate 1-carboxyvinyltransferase [Oligoflexia bacterium]|nr:3-phosphoshikimate 1-carboxyvinyltransferase [Oligoflexia bacterium]
MKRVEPSSVAGTVTLPASKSMLQRAIFAAALARGQSELSNPSDCDDAEVALAAIQVLGAKVQVGDTLVITGGGAPADTTLNCGESGLSMRMLCALASHFEQQFQIIGRGSLTSRPIDMIEEPLVTLGVEVQTAGGFLPVTVKGPIKGGKLSIDGSITSQFLTGLLMTLPLCEEDSELTVQNLASKPYVIMTIELLADFGIQVECDQRMEIFNIQGRQHYQARPYAVEGDWSSAAFMAVAAAIAGTVTLKGLKPQSAQADRAILEVLEQVGAQVEVSSEDIHIEKGILHAFQFDASDCPDLFPILATLACNCEGKSTIAGVNRLKHKESDRALAIAEEFTKLGAVIVIDNDLMQIEGRRLKGGTVDSHNDHRIAMATAIAALNSTEGISIERAAAVSKSYPSFFEDLTLIMENV